MDLTHRRGARGLESRRACPGCGRPASRPFYARPFDSGEIAGYLEAFYEGRLDTAPLRGQNLELVDCGDCALVYQRLIPNAAYLAHIYGEAALADPLEVAAARGIGTRQGYSYDIEQCIKFSEKPATEVEVLDFGSGSGLWLQMAAAYGCRTSGTDLSDDATDRLARHGHRVVAPTDLPAEQYDFINAEQVFEHLVDPLVDLQRLRSSLRPGGLVRISVPNGSDIRERLLHSDWSAPKGSPSSLNAVAPLEHVNCFDPTSLTSLGVAAGLDPFRYPVRQFLDPMERFRFILSAIAHYVRPRSGTLQLFRRPLLPDPAE